MESNNKENKEVGNNDSNNDAHKNPINEINIKGYKYKYKDTYKKGYCYRCIHRYICKLTILICFTEYKKFFNKKEYSIINPSSNIIITESKSNLENPKITEQTYQKIKPLGKGSYSKVFLIKSVQTHNICP